MSTATSTAAAPPPMLLSVLRTMRPKQWIKNAFVLAGVMFSSSFTEPAAVLDALLATVAFCLASGAAYLVNDARDAETDKLNPRTAKRPIARGDLAVAAAYVWSAVALVAGLALATLASPDAALVLAAFFALQLGYSLGLKHVLFVDVMVIATLFVLRALAGAEAIDVKISPWLLLCTGLLALFLGLGKRRGETIALGGESNPQRPVLDSYSVELLDELIAVVTPAVVVVYSVYTILGAKSDTMLATLPFVLYGVFRVLYLMHQQSRSTEEPDTLVFRDPPLAVCVGAWIVVSGAIIGLA